MPTSPVNPYESPSEVPDLTRGSDPARCPELVSLIVIPLAAVVGGSIFTGMLYGMAEFALHDIGLQVSFAAGIAAMLLVQMAVDAHVQQRQPAWGSAIIGMLLASPLAVAVLIFLAFAAYDMGTKRVPGAEIVGMFNLGFFFLTLSFGGWFAVCRTRSVVVLGSAFQRSTRHDRHTS